MRTLVLVACLLTATPAMAQSTSVGVTANWDIARFSRFDFDAVTPLVTGIPDTIDGAALGFGVSVRRAIGENWGVALEFGRSGEIENRSTQPYPPIRILPAIPGTTIPSPIIFPPIPDFAFELRTEQQHQTIAALAWVRHDVGERLDLSYTGGIAFVRSEFESEHRVTDPRLAIYIAPNDLSTIDFNARAMAGVDADIELADHTAFTAGVRLQGLTAAGRSGWLVRPAVGVRWTF